MAIITAQQTQRIIEAGVGMRRIVLGVVAMLAIASLVAGMLAVFTPVAIVEREEVERGFIYRELPTADAGMTERVMATLDASVRERGELQRRPLHVLLADGRTQVGFEMNPSAAALLDAGWVDGKRRVFPAGAYMVVEIPRQGRLPLSVRKFLIRRALAAYRTKRGYQTGDLLMARDSAAYVFWQRISPTATGR